jgi:glutamate--cysteine ligase catalytic subunit
MDYLTEGCTWHPEFGSWMVCSLSLSRPYPSCSFLPPQVESTPSLPYSNYVSDLLRVEKNMILRHCRLLSVLQPNEIVPFVTCFPLMGTTDFVTLPSEGFQSPHSHSDSVPDLVINPHPRFAALVNNIRSRRGSKVDIRIPLYQDTHTPEYLNMLVEHVQEEEEGENVMDPGQETVPAPSLRQPEIEMDCMAYGMGMCCLQVTFQARDVCESRYMYDQLAVLAPIMLAMTAATPLFRGRLADIDARWTVISQSVDDRTPAERGLVTSSDDLQKLATENYNELVGQGVKRQYKSRYDSISTYIYHCSGDAVCERSFSYYNDIPCPVDEEAKATLLEAGVDMNLAHHLAHLFVRDPLVIFEDAIEIDDTVYTDHFENIQSTNWQTVRWKPPPPRVTPEDPHIGWRTEFRSMELQLTDFENAAFTVFVVLITRVILAFDLAFYIPLSKVTSLLTSTLTSSPLYVSVSLPVRWTRT